MPIEEFEVEEYIYIPIPVKKELQKVTRYRTSDGTEFGNKPGAERHEAILNLDKFHSECDQNGDRWYFIESAEKWNEFKRIMKIAWWNHIVDSNPEEFPIWTMATEYDAFRYRYSFLPRKVLVRFLRPFVEGI